MARPDRHAGRRPDPCDRTAAERRRPRADRTEPDAGRRAARASRTRGGRGGMTIALFVVLLLAGTAAVIAPLARRPVAWPADPPDQRDDVARAVSSLRDLEFARAAGTIAPSDYARLRATLERDAFVRRSDEPPSTAPVRTLLAAALIAGVVAGVVAVTLPRSAGDRAPGETVTGTVPRSNDLALYNKKDWNGAVDVWTVYLDVGEFHSASDMVRALYADAKAKAGR